MIIDNHHLITILHYQVILITVIYCIHSSRIIRTAFKDQVLFQFQLIVHLDIAKRTLCTQLSLTQLIMLLLLLDIYHFETVLAMLKLILVVALLYIVLE